METPRGHTGNVSERGLRAGPRSQSLAFPGRRYIISRIIGRGKWGTDV